MDVGTRMLVQMAGAYRFNQWMADTIAPFVNGAVFEAGAGIGTLTTLLFRPGGRYIAADLEPDHLHQLQTRLPRHPDLLIAECDLLKHSDLAPFSERIDTVVCLNVLEHIKDDVAVLRNLRSLLRCGGRAIILVPQGPSAYGSLDRVLRHFRRYSKSELESKIAAAGLHLERLMEFNRITYPGWFFNSRILKRRTLSGTQLRILDLLVPLSRRIDPFLPWPATSLIAVAARDGC
jgi:2-polyprenyl-3-methyl-5-hydroxy-6-metoxy-1,4-benzoquinol methylase